MNEILPSVDWTLARDISLFCLAALVIGFSGSRLAWVADRLADRTGLGEALTGALFLGASTSMPGITTSVTAAWSGHPELSASNAIGGIAAQTAFLAIADITYKKANLEHAAASAENVMQGTLLIALLSILVLATTGPRIEWWGIHPATPAVLAAYLYGMKLVSQTRTQPMWRPHRTPETEVDLPQTEKHEDPLPFLLGRFILLAFLLGTSGWLVAHTGAVISARTGLSETAVGGFFTAVSTSLPELVTCVAAVRVGALTLAVGDIIGGNAFDTLFLAVSDIAYRQGSIYHAVSQRQVFFMVLTILLTGVLLMGLVRREKQGIANIGFESFLILILYVGTICLLFFGDGP